MEFATGAMGAVLPKLGELLQEEYNLQTSVKQGIMELMSELEHMQAALEKVSNVPLDQLDGQVHIWACEVREMSYAIEDTLDSSMVCIKGFQPCMPHTFMGFINKTKNEIIMLKARREMANDIKHIKSQVSKVKERYDRYKIDDVVANPTTAIDPRLSALYNKVSDLVGIDKAMDELAKLSECLDVSEKELKAISVVGFGGWGKTTLAKAFYDKLKKRFDCWGFVPVGQNPDQRKVLRDILHELDKNKYKNITSSQMDIRQLIDELKRFLMNKRYLIVIDDIWDMSTWEIVKCALEESNPELGESKVESRIIVTTRICEVAEKVGGVYNIKLLSDDMSKQLFCRRLWGAKGTIHDDETSEVSTKILRKCGGVPLSIITIASLLVDKGREDWPKVYDAIGFGHEDNEAITNTRKILSFSYYDLPPYLKNCLLHLSIFPEDHLIKKRELIWICIAEGFIQCKQGLRLFDIGESYFNQLANRSMIRLTEGNSSTNYDGCRVHDMVLDLIRNLSMLRVLVLDNCDFSAGACRLEHLGRLVHLRYLGLVKTPVVELPVKIGHDLKFLQTLDIRGSDIEELPASVAEMSKLMCLRAYRITTIMAKIGKLTSLEDLELCVDECPNFVTQLRKLTEMRNLNIRIPELDESMSKALVESLCNLRRIQILMVMTEEYNDDGAWEAWAPPLELREVLLIGICLPRRPSWMDSTCCPHLSYLNFYVKEVREQDLRILGRLPVLRCLDMSIDNTPLAYTIGSDEFRNLRNIDPTIEIIFGREGGALPMLEDLKCCISVGNQDVRGLVPGNMPLLQHVYYELHGKGFTREEVELTEVALRHAATKVHPNRPGLAIDRCYCEYDSDQDDDSDLDDDSDEEVLSTSHEMDKSEWSRKRSLFEEGSTSRTAPSSDDKKQKTVQESRGDDDPPSSPHHDLKSAKVVRVSSAIAAQLGIKFGVHQTMVLEAIVKPNQQATCFIVGCIIYDKLKHYNWRIVQSQHNESSGYVYVKMRHDDLKKFHGKSYGWAGEQATFCMVKTILPISPDPVDEHQVVKIA
ncbi:hypothetical protein VPH35_114342 [Triticum aestivum]|uniref:disease resistance protein Pik-2-like n=1 Tax=Triticum aestivum TaxID=4565 RepID=UPI001D019144|nr:disease resistance protein Pik-2-like [Triticum aestivum]